MSSFMLKIVTLWIIHFFIHKGTDGQSPEFMAPPNPCRVKVDDICSIHCKFITVTIKENGNLEPCQFCYCQNPVDSIVWEPETTSAIPTTTTTIETTTQAPGHYFVNGIHYVELKNACQLTEAMCPVTCLMFNVSGADGRICERCDCLDDDIAGSSLIGRRRNVPFSGTKRCLPMFACPISKCPIGQRMAHGPNGCNFCKCIPTAGTVLSKPNPPRRPFPGPTLPQPVRYSTPEPFETFIQMFCMPEPEYCPRYCPVTTYQVDSWLCHRCTCPVGQTYVALQNPCNIHSNVCPSNCTVRQVQNPYNPSRTCDHCQCESQSKEQNTNDNLIPNEPITRGRLMEQIKQLNRRCSAINSCSITRCPPGQERPLGPGGCPDCRCVQIPVKVLTRSESVLFEKPNQLQTRGGSSHIKPITLTPFPTITTMPLTSVASSITKTTPTTTPHLRSTSSVQGVTTPNSLTQCYICDKALCKEEDLKYCPPGLNYCLSTITQSEDGTRNFTRGCLNESDCYNISWETSSTNSECLGMNNDRKGSAGTSLVCDFCCKGPGCNMIGRISDNHLYTGDDHFL